MIQRYKNMLKKEEGFTLVELIVVIVIIAILAAALVTSLIGYINKARESNALIEANNVLVACQTTVSENDAAAWAVSTDYANGTAIPAGGTITGTIGAEVMNLTGMTAVDPFTFQLDANETITTLTYTTNNVTCTYTAGTGWTTA